MKIDYKKLLKKYIQHVVDCEGVDFISNIRTNKDSIGFHLDEYEEMVKLEKEIFGE